MSPDQVSFTGEPLGAPCVALTAASAASRAMRSACRRFHASNGVSPGRMNLVPSSTGTFAPPCTEAERGAVAVVGVARESAGRSLGASAATSGKGATGLIDVALALVLDPFAVFRRRFAGLRPSSLWSHRRMVSRPISIPISRSPPTSDSADSPAALSRSNSSRCASSCAVAWLRGCRAWATAWASVVGRAVVGEVWMGNDMGVIGERYAQRSGGARGAPRAHSKRKRLDVGVLTYFFLLFWLSELSSFFGFFVGRFIGPVGSLRLYFVFSVGSFRSCSWVESLDLDSLGSRLSDSLDYSVQFLFFELSLGSGGGGC